MGPKWDIVWINDDNGCDTHHLGDTGNAAVGIWYVYVYVLHETTRRNHVRT